MAQQNTAFGIGSLSRVNTGNFNTAIGFQSGNTLPTGIYNTAIGANAFSTGNTFSYSTAIGYNALITGNNQIVMGTAAETVFINGISSSSTVTTGAFQVAGGVGISGNVNIGGNVNIFGDSITNAMVEKYSAGTVTTNAITVAYSSLSNIIAISPSSAANIALTITSLPTTRGTAIYDFTFIISVGTFKQYINSLSVNGSSATMKAANGLANISINTSATVVLQTISIQMNGATVVNAFTNVSSYF
jgi:hypothetical protein